MPNKDRVAQLMRRSDELLTTDMVGTNVNGTKKGGYMNPYQYKTFMEWVQDQSVLLRLIRMEYLTAPSREIDRTGIGRRIMHGRTEAQALRTDQYAKPEFGKMELSTKKAMAQLNMSYETLEDNIERGNFRTRIMRMLAGQVSRDLEDFIINADTEIPETGAGHAVYTDGDDFLCLQDGLLKRTYTQKPSGMPHQNLTGGHIIDAGGAPIDMAHWFDLEDAVPEKYFRSGGFIWLTSRGVDLSWREYLTDRQTGLGDHFVINAAESKALGRSVITTPFLPNQVQMTGAGNPADRMAPGANSFLFLFQPKNLIMGVWRNLLIETDKDIERQVYKIVLSMRVGLTVEEPDAIAVVENVKRRPTRTP